MKGRRCILELDFTVERIVLQPTQLCNLDCSYCYLPDRDKNRKMTQVIAERVAEGIAKVSSIEIIWHGGEPLSCGINHFKQLLDPFEELRLSGSLHHAIQTNGTLIDESWCQLFKEKQFRVGVSIDGPSWTNSDRVDWSGKPAHARILRGLSLLKKNSVDFSTICVVNNQNLGRAQEIYNFMIETGCVSVGINIEEQLGIHRVKTEDNTINVIRFWTDLLSAWKKDPSIAVRDFNRILPGLEMLSKGTEPQTPKVFDIFPSIAWNGDVVLLAPEFLNTTEPLYDNFVVGNITKDDLGSILSIGEKAKYVQDYVSGVGRCQTECEYFSLCYGGQAGNKYFETQSTNATETIFCRNSEKNLVEAILHQAESAT